ncbi:HlyD family type I secretion periplasmic adaptor subunit [Vibrio viridaestus]|uniref:Membrane fusion protein (MFP) family protein n=1 Tax=Vibrio viridaestus TaxID=2487322 RepID=A0A3N9U700_9VIBR|nr:HlyD family type I secretion periplasmic adaptor subunit [Vibrio viridaestus]RQW63896.1 HlyD family type I secretion periplasmic adaptor subunit [Vibrio viridaestus]
MIESISYRNIIIENNNNLIKQITTFIVITLVVFLAWGCLVKLESASVSSGIVIVESKKKNIQHLEGGIVESVFVTEGQRVNKGQPLLKVSDISSNSKLNQIKLTLISYKLQYMRLIAERNNKSSFTPEIDFDGNPLLNSEVATMIQNQKSLFFSRISMQQKEISILDSRLVGAKNLITSTKQMIEQKEKVLNYLDQEIQMHEKLIDKGYTSKQKILELKRSEASLQSDIISMQSNIEDNKSTINELNKQKKAVTDRNLSDIEDQLSTVRNKIVDLSSQLQSQNDLQSRTIIRSPSDGVVMNMQINTAGEIINPAQTIMEIVPDNDKLIIQTLIKPTDIDVVKVGQNAEIRFTAYNFRTTPLIKGTVTLVDADRSMVKEGDKENSGYKVQIMLDPTSLSRDKELNLYPGMPVEVYILNKEKSPISYLVEPFENSLSKAFREN